LYNETIQNYGEEVCTPFGKKLKSNVHYLGNKQHLDHEEEKIQIIDNFTHGVKESFHMVIKNGYMVSGTNTPANQDPVSGWITYCNTILLDGSQCTYFSTTYVVPSAPIKKSKQIIYIFNAFEGLSDIIQPVLQWGLSPAGGGDYWSICNWYVNEDQDQIFFDSLIKVSTGTKLEGIIRATKNSNYLYDYNASFQGYPTGIQVNNLPAMQNLYISLEVHNLKGDDEYPSNEKITMSDIQIRSENNYPPIRWGTMKKSWTKVEQFTKIVNENANYGEVEIHFHSPYSDDNYNDIHVYPNPFEDIIHISTNTIKDPLLLFFPDQKIVNCTLEIYSMSGVLVESYFYKDMNYEFDLNLQHLAKGAYIFKFKYFFKGHSSDLIMKDHSFKIFKN